MGKEDGFAHTFQRIIDADVGGHLTDLSGPLTTHVSFRLTIHVGGTFIAYPSHRTTGIRTGEFPFGAGVTGGLAII